MSTLSIDVHGIPAPQGSKRAIPHRATGRPIMIESNHAKVQTWREDVKAAALQAVADREGTGDPFATLGGPIWVEIDFYFPRPKSHYRTGRNAHLLRDQAPHRPAGKPDLDKLLRSTFDALTIAGVWADDKLAVDVHAAKRYVDEYPGCHVGAVITLCEAT